MALYRAGLILPTVGDISRSSRLIEKSVEMAPAYSDLRKKAARYYVARYIYERGRASANVSYLSRVLAILKSNWRGLDTYWTRAFGSALPKG